MPYSRRRARLAASIAGFGVALTIAACGSSDGPASSASGDPAPGVAETGSALEHIHGLGVDPSDGRLFIATHNGLFSAPEQGTTPEPVGDSDQDIMGFSVVGDNRFIGSGHPGSDRGQPPNLGLIESRDGGRSWKSISLLGDADFHVLESSGSRVYGFDGTRGRLMVSGNGGRDWQQRTPPAAMFDLAIAPTDDRRIIAATESGIFESPDEGRSWRSVRDDLAGLLAWPAKKELYLVDGEGQIQVSSDGGARWRTVGDIGGQPAAFIAHRDDLYAALADGTVKRSTDGGANWTVRTTA